MTGKRKFLARIAAFTALFFNGEQISSITKAQDAVADNGLPGFIVELLRDPRKHDGFLGRSLKDLMPNQSWDSLFVPEEYKDPEIKYAAFSPLNDFAKRWNVVTPDTCVSGYSHIGPFLNVQSPEKRCGKTMLLSLIAKLVKRALPSSNISGASIYRVIEEYCPTLVIDEPMLF